MSLIKTIEIGDLGEGVVSKPKSEMLIAGDPTFTAWNQDGSRDGLILTGVWQATPGTTKSIKGDRFEFCTLLEGVVELSWGDGEVRTYKAGDSFVMKPGFVGTWKTIETVKKIYVVVD